MEMINHYERVCAYIDLDAVLHNMEQMHNRIKQDCGIMCVIKTDAYGHGAVQIGRELEQLPYVKGMAVATPEEALVLRHCGIQKPILVLGYVFPYAYEDMIKADVRMSVFRNDMLDAIDACASKIGKKAKVHIKVDTAMNRIGIKADDDGLKFIKQCINKEHIETEGIFTHFGKADEADKTDAFKHLNSY